MGRAAWGIYLKKRKKRILIEVFESFSSHISRQTSMFGSQLHRDQNTQLSHASVLLLDEKQRKLSRITLLFVSPCVFCSTYHLSDQNSFFEK